MKEPEEIENWTDDDFKLPQVGDPPVDDPWSVDRRPGTSNGPVSLLRESEDNALSKEAAPSKPGIYEPIVDRIRPYVPPSSRQSNQNRTEFTPRTKNDAAQTDKDPWGFQIPSNRPLPQALQDPSQPAPEDSSDTDVDWSFELENESSNLAPIDPPRDPYYDTDFDGYLADEPEITAEYEPDLHEFLFQTSIPNRSINRSLAIDEWLASLEQLDEDTVVTITSTLLKFTNSRFAYWISWLRQQSWDEFTLVRFFAFRELYGYRKDYWQRKQFRRTIRRWQLIEDYYSLSLADSLTLIQGRIQHPVDRIIDDEWIYEWDNLDVSFLYANNCLRFSEFALYRSQLSYGEDWKQRADLGFDFESDLLLMTRDGGIRRFKPGRGVPYDHSEPTPSFDSDAWLESLNARNAIDQYDLGIDRTVRGF